MRTRILRSSTGWLWLARACVLAVAVGCGGGGAGVNKVTVAGTASYNGAPIERGAIEFYLQEATLKGGSNATGVIKDGKFSVPGVSPGKNIVTVSSASDAQDIGPATYETTGKMPVMNQETIRRFQVTKGKAADDQIPREAAGNGLVVDVKPDMAPLDIKIQKK